MGADTRFFHFDKCDNRAELDKRWRDAVREDTYERGHDSYNGSIRNVESLSVHPVRYKTAGEAERARDAYDADKREAMAFGYGDPTKVFPQTAGDKKMVDNLAKLKKELETFDFDILCRFAKGKTSSRKCSHCESVISRKSRQTLALRPPTRNQDNFAYRDALHELTACPACGHNLLITDTDKKLKASLEKRVHELTKKVEDAEKAFYAKKPTCGYFIVAVCPS